MSKVVYKKNRNCVYEVYGAKEHIEKYKNWDKEWNNNHTKLLIYGYNNWIWVDGRDYEPFMEE